MKKYEEILEKYWGYTSFRGIQEDIIKSIGSGKDTLGLMPTGGGKSITFQVPALAMDGVCIVITPLIALMKDQVMHLQEKNINSVAIYSGMARQEIIKTLENCILGRIKILYISPERLSSELFQTKLRHINVSFITVDEAHCISQWGYDFRPSYLRIKDIRDIKPNVPILALTATATPKVVIDIQNKLQFTRHNVFRMSFERKNLGYIIRNTLDKDYELLHILNSVPGSAIVYVRNRKRTNEVAKLLMDSGILATYYHAGLESVIKDLHQKQWQNGEIRVIVATNAFGMGIDKSDVRLVIHYDCPDSIEAYFQEAGRGGRDGKRSYAVLLYNKSDKIKLRKRIAENFPDKETIRNIYEHLAYYYQIGIDSGCGYKGTFEIDTFCHTFHHHPIQTEAALHILQRAGYITYEAESEARARIMFLLHCDELYRLKEGTAQEECVITALLRTYGGLFTDYSYIDISLIAQESGLNHEQVYTILKMLSQRKIVHFIPQRKTPVITYLTNRIDSEHIILSKEIYEERKDNYASRIDALISYIENNEVCRSLQLLAYFGEKQKNDCHCCDVCANHYGNITKQQKISAKALILDVLADGKPHPLTILRNLYIPKKQFEQTIAELVSEEIILVNGSQICLNN